MSEIYLENAAKQANKQPDFLNFGHYVIEPAPIPEYLMRFWVGHMGLKCGKLLTASICICNMHPLLEGSFWIDHKEDQRKYHRALKLPNEEFSGMKETVEQLFNGGKLDIDSRFVCLSDAVFFREKYLQNLPDLKIISIYLEDVFRDELLKDCADWLNAPAAPDSSRIEGKFLGYDLLGWSISGFHSHYCNALMEYFPKNLSLKINEFGIIQNKYEEVKAYAKAVMGKGEPVNWLPFAVYGHNF